MVANKHAATYASKESDESHAVSIGTVSSNFSVGTPVRECPPLLSYTYGVNELRLRKTPILELEHTVNPTDNRRNLLPV